MDEKGRSFCLLGRAGLESLTLVSCRLVGELPLLGLVRAVFTVFLELCVGVLVFIMFVLGLWAL